MSVRRSVTLVVLLAVCACGRSNPMSPSGASARTVYVSTTGSDRNDGTIAAPWLTLRHAVAQLNAGDTLYIRGGSYTGAENTIDSQVAIVRSGTSWSNAITIAGYPSETVTIQPPNGTSAIRLTTGGPAYLIFQDLIVDGINLTGEVASGIFLSTSSNHNRFQRIEVKNCSNFGIHFDDVNFNEVLNSSIHDNGSGNSPFNGHGLYITASDNLFDGNTVYNNRGYGLHLYNNAGPRNVTRNVVRNNRIYDNGRHGGTAYGIVVAWGDANQVYNNMIYGNPGGIQVHTNSSGTAVYNNTIHNNTPAEGIVIQYATGTVVRDNVLYANGIDILDLGTGTVLSNNRSGP